MGFGERLRDAMLGSGVSVPRIAGACKTSRASVYNWLKLEKPNISVDNLVIVGTLTGTSLRWLATGEGSPIPAPVAVRV